MFWNPILIHPHLHNKANAYLSSTLPFQAYLRFRFIFVHIFGGLCLFQPTINLHLLLDLRLLHDFGEFLIHLSKASWEQALTLEIPQNQQRLAASEACMSQPLPRSFYDKLLLEPITLNIQASPQVDNSEAHHQALTRHGSTCKCLACGNTSMSNLEENENAKEVKRTCKWQQIRKFLADRKFPLFAWYIFHLDLNLPPMISHFSNFDFAGFSWRKAEPSHVHSCTIATIFFIELLFRQVSPFLLASVIDKGCRRISTQTWLSTHLSYLHHSCSSPQWEPSCVCVWSASTHYIQAPPCWHMTHRHNIYTWRYLCKLYLYIVSYQRLYHIMYI